MCLTLHLFNPWHDDALAAGSPYYNPSRFAARMSRALAALPAWWAAEGDVIACAEAPDAAWRQRTAGLLPEVRYETAPTLEAIERVEPWGWDAVLCHRLWRRGWQGRPPLPPAEIRRLSSRATAVAWLPLAVGCHPLLTGRSWLVHDMSEVERLWNEVPEMIVKSPWSCSGRGTRYITPHCTPSERGWMAATLRRQGALAVEPYYRKVADFALEFMMTAQGAHYEGLSLFHTEKGNYAANLVCSELQARQHIERLTWPGAVRLLCAVWTTLLNRHMPPAYRGPLGIDMMVVSTAQGHRIHPCVEVNLRRTMGWVALQLRRLVPEGYSGRLFVSATPCPEAKGLLPLVPEGDGPCLYLEHLTAAKPAAPRP